MTKSVVEAEREWNAAWNHFRSLLRDFGIYRTYQQDHEVSNAYQRAQKAATRYESAKFWEKYHAKSR